jgi:hypothetical protein
MRFKAAIGTDNQGIGTDIGKLSQAFSTRYKNADYSQPQIQIGLQLAIV